MSAVWNLPCENHTEKLVLLALADNANDQSVCWPSLETLARKCELTRQGVLNRIEKLITKGRLKVRKADGRVNVYELVLGVTDPSTRFTRQQGLPVNSVDPHPSTAFTGPVNAVDPNHKEPSIETSKRKRSQSVFQKPEFSEMESYAKQIQLSILEVNAFNDFHEARGWMMGKYKVKDWRAAMRTWKRNSERFATRGTFAGNAQPRRQGNML